MNIAEVVSAVRSVLPDRRPIEHHEAFYGELEIQYVNDCLKSGVTGYGYVKGFEEKLKQVCGVEHAIAMVNGTAALHIALIATGVMQGEEVLLPTMTFAGTANAIIHAGAIPHFIDGGLTLNAFKLRQYLATKTTPAEHGRVNKETGRKITTLIVVHLLGIPAPMSEIKHVASAFGLKVIEDAAEAIGSKCGNSPCGSLGIAGILSFNNNKTVTTNGGGALLTNDPKIAARALQLSTTARVPHAWRVEHDDIAWNYRLPNLCAAFGLAQLERLDEILAAKQRLARAYSDALSGVRGVGMVGGIPGSNHWLNALMIDQDHCGRRDTLLHALHNEGIRARAIFTPLHKLQMYRDNPRSDAEMSSAEAAERGLVCLPSGAALAA